MNAEQWIVERTTARKQIEAPTLACLIADIVGKRHSPSSDYDKNPEWAAEDFNRARLANRAMREQYLLSQLSGVLIFSFLNKA